MKKVHIITNRFLGYVSYHNGRINVVIVIWWWPYLGKQFTKVTLGCTNLDVFVKLNVLMIEALIDKQIQPH